MKKYGIVILVCISSLLIAGALLYSRQSKNYTVASCSIKHLGIIMDGNRRWAKKNGFKPWIGHKQGVDPVKTTLEFCLKHKIPYVTLYAFSLENFKRSQEELHYLFDILAQELADKELNNLFEKGIQVRFIGDKNKFPEQLRETVHTVETKTAQNNKLIMNILFCYGGQQEILAATQAIARCVATGTLKPEDITPDVFENALWTGIMPGPDLIIRTGGAQRTSNFLVYQSAYSELLFLDCYWPEITEQHLIDAVIQYESTQRRFGA